MNDASPHMGGSRRRPDGQPLETSDTSGGQLLTARQVAEQLAISPATVLDWHEAGRLPAIRLGGTERGRIRFRQSTIDALLEAWTTGSAA
jgi:excisionase family DNA binding protein